MFLYSGATGKSWVIIINQHCSITASSAYIAQMKMQNDFKSKAQTSLISSYTYLTNMLDMSAITLHYVFKATPPYTDTSVKKRLWQL